MHFLRRTCAEGQRPANIQGIPGPQGLPGEVTSAALASAIAGTSATNGVSTLDVAFTNDPLSLADGELLRAKINELINAMRR